MQVDEVATKYNIDLAGSMAEYRYLLDRQDKYHIIFFNGDWDSIIPYSDTIQNIGKLNLLPTDI